MKIYNVIDYGCSGAGADVETEKIQTAIDTSHAKGGGVVYFPPGKYLAGSIELKSHVTLHLEAGAVLEASTCTEHYRNLPFLESIYTVNSPDEPTAVPSAFLYAQDAENIAIQGRGVIHGNGCSFMSPLNTPVVPDYVPGWHAVPHYWSAPKPRPCMLINFFSCQNILVRDITLQDSFAWTLTFFLSDHITVQNVQIFNESHLMNADGIDIVDSSHVCISDCRITTADDGICLKNINWKTPPADHLKRPVEHVTVTNCIIKTHCTGFKLGTDSQHGFRNINFSNSIVSTPGKQHDPLLYAITGVALEAVDGGSISNISISNITMDQVRCPFFIRLANRGRNMNPPRPGSLQDVNLSNIIAKGCILPSLIMGIPGAEVKNVNLANLNLKAHGKDYPRLPAESVPQGEKAYPEAVQFGPLPSFGIYCRHAEGINVCNSRLSSEFPDSRPSMLFEEVKLLHISNVTTPAETINVSKDSISGVKPLQI